MNKGLTFVDFLEELGLGFLFLVCFVIIGFYVVFLEIETSRSAGKTKHGKKYI